jgi:site-specific DNA-methyltransferase (adenine-specific)
MNYVVEQGDCLQLMKEKASQSVDLVYLDPPFFSNKKHSLMTKDRNKIFSFDDIWKNHRDYTMFMLERLQEIYRLLKSTGSIFLHCDRYANHILRFLLDEVFGQENFRSEIIWTYKRWSNSVKGLLPAHQTIFFTLNLKNSCLIQCTEATLKAQMLIKYSKNALETSMVKQYMPPQKKVKR